MTLSLAGCGVTPVAPNVDTPGMPNAEVALQKSMDDTAREMARIGATEPSAAVAAKPTVVAGDLDRVVSMQWNGALDGAVRRLGETIGYRTAAPVRRRRPASMSRSIRPRGASTTSFMASATRPATPRQCASISSISSSRSSTMADRRSFLLAATSLAALGLMAPADAADMTTTPPAQPYVAPAPVAVPVTTTAPPARDNSLIVMPIPPQPSPATVDAAARQTGNPINKPVTGASIEPEVVGGERPLSLESLQATRPGSGLQADGLEAGRQGHPLSGGPRLWRARRARGVRRHFVVRTQFLQKQLFSAGHDNVE